MNRVKYQYQVIRFMPDTVSGEFVNVGVVVFSPEQKFLKAEVIDKYKRITQFFGSGVNGAYLLNTLKFIKSTVNHKGNQFNKELLFELPVSLEAITCSILPKDDSSLVFTEASTGLDINLERAFLNLKNRYVNEMPEEEHTLKDKEVWTKMYKKYFDEQGISDKLKHKTITTSLEQFDFDMAYKNGKWNCIEAFNFELKHDDSIKEKVYRLIGKFDALSKSNEPLRYHILAHFRSGNHEINTYVKKMLEHRKSGKVELNLVTEKEAKKFASEVKDGLEHKE